jgi:hypothetical protein
MQNHLVCLRFVTVPGISDRGSHLTCSAISMFGQHLASNFTIIVREPNTVSRVVFLFALAI